MPSDPHQITKPTIAELEAMLAKGPEGLRVQINPDGSVRVIELPVIHDLNILDEDAETHG
jgi:hypothetical protein